MVTVGEHERCKLLVAYFRPGASIGKYASFSVACPECLSHLLLRIICAFLLLSMIDREQYIHPSAVETHSPSLQHQTTASSQ